MIHENSIDPCCHRGVPSTSFVEYERWITAEGGLTTPHRYSIMYSPRSSDPYIYLLLINFCQRLDEMTDPNATLKAPQSYTALDTASCVQVHELYL